MHPRLPLVAGMIAAAALTASCGGGLRRFEAEPIVWVDEADRRPFSPRPEETWAPQMWAAVDNMMFRPLSEMFAFEPSRESVDVNALDEVPDSSWYVNRIARRPMTPAEVAAGACPSVDVDVPAPWRVVSGKLEGASPGFIFEDANGVRYLLKTDREQQPEQATGADAVVASVFHAAGYHVPCNRVVGFDADMLVLDPEASIQAPDGDERPMTETHVREVVDAAFSMRDGRRRALISRFVEGQPIGPWAYQGTREGDPNDVIPHEHRRELRGMYALASWVGRWDARTHNTLSAWVERGDGSGYVRHYMIDFGETLGLMEGNFRRARRFGHSQWLDVQHVVEDTLALGIPHRPWDDPPDGPAHEVLGNFDVEHFDADEFRPDYWNRAFQQRTESDVAWMARIIARFDRPHVEALAELGMYADPATEAALVEVLMGRRRKILERYLTRLSPLTDPVLEASGGQTRLCMTDLAVHTGIRDRDGRRYTTRAYAGDPLAPIAAPAVAPGPRGRVCVPLPDRAAARPTDAYVVLDVTAESAGRETTGPARLHLLAGGSGRTQILGLERPDDADPPT